MSLETQYPEIHSALEDARFGDVDFYIDQYSGMLMRGLYKLKNDYQDLPIRGVNNDESLTGASCGSMAFDPEKRVGLDPLLVRNPFGLAQEELEKRVLLSGPAGNESWHRFITDYLPKFLEWNFKIDAHFLCDFNRDILSYMDEYVLLQSRVLSLIRADGKIEDYEEGDYKVQMRLYCNAELQIKDDVRALIRSVAPYLNFVFSAPEHHITEAHIMGEVPITEIPQYIEPV